MMAPLAQHSIPEPLCYPHQVYVHSCRAIGSWPISSLLPHAWMLNDLHLSVEPPLEAPATTLQQKDARHALRTSTGCRALWQRHPKLVYPCPNGLLAHASAALPLSQPFPRHYLSADNPLSLAITLCSLTGWSDLRRTAKPSHCPPFLNSHTSPHLLADGIYSQPM